MQPWDQDAGQLPGEAARPGPAATAYANGGGVDGEPAAAEAGACPYMAAASGGGGTASALRCRCTSLSTPLKFSSQPSVGSGNSADEEDDELSRELARELTADFLQLTCDAAAAACGGSGGGGDPPEQRQGGAAGSEGVQLEQQQRQSGCPSRRGSSPSSKRQRSNAALDSNGELQPSLYDQMGGGVVAKKLVDVFYRRVLDDPALSYFFDGVDMPKHARKFLLFVTYVLGGPDEYLQLNPEPWTQLAKAHERLVEHLGLSEEHFDAVKRHFGESLQHLGAPQLLADQALAIVESTRRIMFPLPSDTPPCQQ